MIGYTNLENELKRAIEDIDEMDITHLFDIDGVIVETFDGKGLNQAAYANQVKNQKIDFNLMEKIKRIVPKWQHGNVFYITGRKRSLLGEISYNQMNKAWNLDKDEKSKPNLVMFTFYPEQFDYDMDLYRNWKIMEYLKWCCPNLDSYEHKRFVVIWEDDKIISSKLDEIIKRLKLNALVICVSN